MSQPPQGQQARPVAQPPQGSLAKPGSGEVLYQGIAKHSASLGGYFKWAGASILAGAAAIAVHSFAPTVPGWILGLFWLVGLPGLLITYLVHTSTKFKVTARRVETEHGVLSKTVDSLELWRVLDVKYNQSLIDRIFDNGRITLVSTDQSHPSLELHGLPGHRELFEKLRDAVQDARQTNRPMELVGDEHGHALEMH